MNQFQQYQKEADLIISHGGTGALISALKLGKKVIAVPRRKMFEEHIDDHQMQVTEVLAEKGYVISVENIKDLEAAIIEMQKRKETKKYDRPSYVIEIIKNYIETQENR